jgi:hypothetical protein
MGTDEYDGFGFNPDDLNEMASVFSKVAAHHSHGFIMEFSINKLDAMDTLDDWTRAMLGDVSARRRCMMEYGKIMVMLQILVDASEDDLPPPWGEGKY